MTREDYMQEAINLALKGSADVRPNPKVGCILVKNKRLLVKAIIKNMVVIMQR